MLSKVTAQLVEEIARHFGEDDRVKAREDPEAYLVSMLIWIKKELPEVSAMLYGSIELAGYEENLKEARRKIDEAEASSETPCEVF